MSAHQAWLEAPYQQAEAEADRWESFRAQYADDVRAELIANPDDYMREEVGEYVSQNLQFRGWAEDAFLAGMAETFDRSLTAAVTRALEAKYKAPLWSTRPNPNTGNPAMKQPNHAKLQLLMMEWLRDNGHEFGARLHACAEGCDSPGIPMGDFMLTADRVGMHMATAAYAAMEAMAAVVGMGESP